MSIFCHLLYLCEPSLLRSTRINLLGRAARLLLYVPAFISYTHILVVQLFYHQKEPPYIKRPYYFQKHCPEPIPHMM